MTSFHDPDVCHSILASLPACASSTCLRKSYSGATARNESRATCATKSSATPVSRKLSCTAISRVVSSAKRTVPSPARSRHRTQPKPPHAGRRRNRVVGRTAIPASLHRRNHGPARRHGRFPDRAGAEITGDRCGLANPRRLRIGRNVRELAMFAIIGIIIVFGCVVAGYLMEHGNLRVLVQPAELIIIGGAAVGTLLFANPLHILKKIAGGIGGVFGSSKLGNKT